ncbi:MAG: hypothetical protein GQ470_01190, partial [Gammaproteobacteria bacterium]|nr:hypothetical protein [Gammaproteobacteria bacterium]
IHEIIEEGKSALDEVNNGFVESENRIQAELNNSVDEVDETISQASEAEMDEEADLLGADDGEEKPVENAESDSDQTVADNKTEQAG